MDLETDSKEYEKIVTDIFKSVFERVEGVEPTQVRYGSENKRIGKSSYEHQIDVSIEHQQNLYLVECKCWKNSVYVEKILAFYARILDIASIFEGQTHGVIVTTKGFNSGVRTLADHYGIDLLIVQSANQFAFKYKHLTAHAIGYKTDALLIREDDSS